MITKDNPSLNSTAESIFLSNADVNILEQCRAREDAIAHEKYQNELIEDLKSDLDSANSQISSLTYTNSSLSSEITALKKLLDDNGIKY